MGLAPPVVNVSGSFGCCLVGGKTVELILPFGVCPGMAAVHDGAIPHGVEVGVASEESYFHIVGTFIGLAAEVHRLMEVSDDMNQNFHSQLFLRHGRNAVGENGNLFADSAHCVAVRVEGCVGIVYAFVYVLVVPCFGIGIIRSVAGVVEPVRPIDRRFALKNGGN